jgi:hypothetical protein
MKLSVTLWMKALRHNRIIYRLRRLFARHEPGKSGHGGFCYGMDGSLIGFPLSKSESSSPGPEQE